MNGIIVVDKPSGMTSHDVVLFVRRRFRVKKVGHAGTLDPQATGVLVLMLGRATSLSNSLISDNKEYEGILRLGIRTDTSDGEGRVISKRDFSGLRDEVIKSAFDSFRGEIEQIPPMVSALKHKGRKLYELARRGIEVERKPRSITIYDINVDRIELPDVWFSMRCTKGTYVRKLADDIGEKLGCGGHLAGLRRTRSGRFSIEDAVSLDELRGFDDEALARLLRLTSSASQCDGDYEDI